MTNRSLSSSHSYTGATLEEVPESDDPSTWKFNGSTIVVEASSKEEVIGILKSDVYAKEGVWDVDNVSCSFLLFLRHT